MSSVKAACIAFAANNAVRTFMVSTEATDYVARVGSCFDLRLSAAVLSTLGSAHALQPSGVQLSIALRQRAVFNVPVDFLQSALSSPLLGGASAASAAAPGALVTIPGLFVHNDTGLSLAVWPSEQRSSEFVQIIAAGARDMLSEAVANTAVTFQVRM